MKKIIKAAVASISKDHPKKMRNRSLAGILAVMGILSVDQWDRVLDILELILELAMELVRNG